ncbi:hypothetical protein POM88_053980 [Heracleum sosnowskyi]|uniref:Importin beta n=1 Tax=Heracleum sosnowskyi TaxID=360622 RepID=A0AAD8GPG1_9APIA|nr:hypothetical protein POM88_053979 [Heracleum sosnowskyi]KAK1351839.1 hypothetical protein POM88_053980 [Heracleum sosnowskyi]
MILGVDFTEVYRNSDLYRRNKALIKELIMYHTFVPLTLDKCCMSEVVNISVLASFIGTASENFLRAHSASEVQNFSESCTPEILAPYLDGIVGKLLVLLQNGNQMVQEGALTALASIADISQEHFQKYYDAVMPYLKAILMNATDKTKRTLRARSMECISLIGMAVGKDKFRDEYSDAEIDESNDESIETITLGDKRIGIKTSVLKEKVTACNMICCYVDELKE